MYVCMYVAATIFFTFFIFTVLYVSNLANFGEVRACSYDAKY